MSRYFKFALTYIFFFPFAIWKSNNLRFKMLKQKIWSDFNRLQCGKTEKIFAGTLSFKKCVEISSSVERKVLPNGSKLGKNETNDADTLIIHDTAAAYIFVSTAFYPPKYNYSLFLSCLKFVSSRLNTNPVHVHGSLHFFATDMWTASWFNLAVSKYH